MKRGYRDFFNEIYLKEYFKLSGMNPKVIEEWMAPTLAARIGELNSDDQTEIIEKLQTILKN